MTSYEYFWLKYESQLALLTPNRAGKSISMCFATSCTGRFSISRVSSRGTISCVLTRLCAVTENWNLVGWAHY